jgi:hypothetical protein
MDNPLQSLVDAYQALRTEAARYADDELRRAALKDAARVLQAIDEIENGANHNQLTSTQLERIALDFGGNLSFREL